MLTILSPCILPILPFVFARAGQPFLRSTLPLLAGMAITFAAVATLAAIGGSWAINANEYGRLAALSMLSLFGIGLMSPKFASVLSRPVVEFGNRLANAAGKPMPPRRSLAPCCSASPPGSCGRPAPAQSSGSC